MVNWRKINHGIGNCNARGKVFVEMILGIKTQAERKNVEEPILKDGAELNDRR